MDSNENHFESEHEDHNQFFQVSPDGYNTESDTQTIMDLNDDEEDTQTQNQDYVSNDRHTSQQDHQNQKSEENEEQRFNEQSPEENEEENYNEKGNENDNQEKVEDEENHDEEENQHNDRDEHNEEPKEEQDNGHEQDNEQENENENGQENENGNEQGNEHEREQEDQEEDEEENDITDPNIKKLMKMDLADKEGIIDLLMKDNLVKKSNVQKDIITKSQNKKKFGHVEPTIGKIPIGNEKSSYGRKGFQIEVDEGNPEFIKDMNVAAAVVKTQIEEENINVELKNISAMKASSVDIYNVLKDGLKKIASTAAVL